jgi:drug/metabolite transporter (DMT)-like permease
MRANMINIKYSIFDYIFGSGLAQILILLAVLNGQSTNSSSLRICQLLLFPLVILHTVENLEKSDKAKLKTPPKILLQRDFNLKSVLLLSLVLGAFLLSISAPFINVFVPDNNGFNYTLLYSYTFFIILNSILIPYFNIFKNTNNYRIIQEARKYYLFTLGFFLILGQELPELDRLVLLLGLSTIPMIFKFEIGRRRLLE